MDIEQYKNYSWSRTLPLISTVGGPIGFQAKGFLMHFSLWVTEKLLNQLQSEMIDKDE